MTHSNQVIILRCPLVVTRLFFLFFLVFSLPVLADSNVSQLQSTYRKAQDWQADFVQVTYVDLLKQTVQKKGSLKVKKPGKLRIEYTEEGGRLYVSDGKKLYVYSPDDWQVEVFPKLSKILAREALTFLEGLGEVEKEFSAQSATPKEKGDSMIGDKTLFVLKLTPRKKDSSIRQVFLGLDAKKDFLVREMTFFNASGNKTHYVFSDIRINSGLKDEIFDFKIPEGITVIKN